MGESGGWVWGVVRVFKFVCVFNCSIVDGFWFWGCWDGLGVFIELMGLLCFGVCKVGFRVVGVFFYWLGGILCGLGVYFG
jgi:hypothetical protein